MSYTSNLRTSNYELLRIVCILTIILGHFVGQSGFYSFSSLKDCAYFSFGTSLSRVSCSVFMIISSWFLVEQNFKISRAIKTACALVFYTAVITIYGIWSSKFGTEVNLFMALHPLEESPLWFASYYVIFVMMTPFLNVILKDKRLLEYYLFFYFIFSPLYSTLTCRQGFFNNSIWVFMSIYLFVGYIKKYRPVFIPNNIFLPVMIFAGTYIGLNVIRSFSIYFYINKIFLGSSGEFFGYVRAYSDFYNATLETLPNLIMAFSLFVSF